ncbi:MAG: hypothetical protein S4CHLAM7_11090 [Chlamydiae bacterium]|nr:hypothetical protein [Chlamydiota bacterium]
MKSNLWKISFATLLAVITTSTTLAAKEGDDLMSDTSDVLSIEKLYDVKDLSSVIEDSTELNTLESKNYNSESASRSSNRYSKKYLKKEAQSQRKSWIPHIEEHDYVSDSSSLFFRTDIGLGLLYFKQVSNFLSGAPAREFSLHASNGIIKGGLMYNRTPLYEFILGYRFLNYLQAAFSFVHQGNVTIQTNPSFANYPERASVGFYQLTSNLDLNAILLKLYVTSPWTLYCKSTMTNLYLGTGIGPGWQSWVSNTLNVANNQDNTYRSVLFPLKQKISANLVWMSDLGFKVQGVQPIPPFSLLFGCKFNLWGQARNIGKLTQQSSSKFALSKPFTIKTIYQWSPYIGFQWNFSNVQNLIQQRTRYSNVSKLSTQFNVGAGFLYFRKLRGNLIGKPNQNGDNDGWQSAPAKGKISYNRTPLFEFLIQQQLNPFFKTALSFQTQGGISVSTNPTTTNASSSFVADTARLVSYLNLNSMQLKIFYQQAINEGCNFADFFPFLGFGVGAGWQTWTRTYAQRSGYRGNTLEGGFQPLKQKVSANILIGLDAGLQATRTASNGFFSAIIGCRYNYWGQARNIGKQSQQGGRGPWSMGLEEPFRIKKIYQWSPYLGVQWNFIDSHFSKKPLFISGKSPASWKPFFGDIVEIQKAQAFFTQFNMGIGFLYFMKVQGNLAGYPQYETKLARDVKIKGRLSYNRTPLFDYQFGYRFCNWLKAALSYQHQGNVTVQTDVLPNAIEDDTWTNQFTQLAADLTLDALFLKGYLECPKALIWKNCATVAYLGMGVGPCWQTWKRGVLVQPVAIENYFNTVVTSLRQKTSANFGLIFDLGFRTQSACLNTGFSMTCGLKLNLWGQARNLGNFNDQLNPRFGLKHPFRIKQVYQWAPYLGVQWNF